MPLANPTDREALAQAPAETDKTASTADPWTLVQQYQRVLEYTGENLS